MEIKIPELALVTLIGTSGSGKSTFAKKHFKQTEIISSDQCRGIVSDDENKIPVRIQTEVLVGSIKADLMEYSGLRNNPISKIKD